MDRADASPLMATSSPVQLSFCMLQHGLAECHSESTSRWKDTDVSHEVESGYGKDVNSHLG